MSPGNLSETPEDQIAARAEALDEAIAQGESTLPADLEPDDPEAQAAFLEARASLELLERVWPRAGAGAIPGVESGTDSPSGRFGRFRIVRELGRGGFGIVFLALDPDLVRPVALKIPRAEALLNVALRGRFVREAKAEGALDHPNIVPLYETGLVGSVCYMASAYCEGPTLSAWLKERTEPVPCRLAAQLVASLADAAEHAHERGVIHRDLKPSNVLLQHRPPEQAPAEGAPRHGSELEWTPRIADFGLARLIDWPGEEATASSAPMGTAAYMAPEQVEGRKVGPATDLYGLGAILYTLLCGRGPHRGQTDLETLHRVVFETPIPPSRLRADIPRDLESICLKCLEKSPENRYSSAQVLADDLRRFLEGSPTQARPLPRWERSRRWACRHPAVSLALVLSAVFAGIVIGGRTWYRDRLAEERGAIQQRDVEASLLKVDAGNARYVADIRQAAQYLSGFETRFADELLRRHLPRVGENDRRDFVWHHLWRRCHTESRTLLGHHDDVYHVEYSARGDLLTSTGKDGRVLLWNTATWQLVRTIPAHDTEVNVAAFSPDGQLLATSGDDGLAKLWEVATGRLKFTLAAHPGKEGNALFTPDGKSLITESKDGLVKTWEVATGTELSSFHLDEAAPAMCTALSPDGTILATGGQQQIRLWDLAHRVRIRTLEGQHGRVLDLSFSHDGKLIAAVGEVDQAVQVYEASTGRLLHELRGHGNVVCSVRFSPDDRMVVSGSQDQTIRVWDLGSGTLRTLHLGHIGRVWGVTFSPDGRTIASAGADGTVKLWDPLENGVRTVLPQSDVYGYLAFRPDSRSLVFVGLRGVVTVWDARRGVVRETRTLVPSGAGGVALSPDGARAAFTPLPDGSVEIWDLLSWQRLVKVGLLGHRISHLGFDPSGLRLAVNIIGEGLSLRDSQTGREVSFLKGDHRPLVFTPDGKRLCLASSSGWMTWEPATEEVRALEIADVEKIQYPPCFSPDGRILVVASNEPTRSTVLFLDWGSLEPRLSLKRLANRAGTLAISADGRTLATGGWDGLVMLWDMATGEELLTLEKQTAGVSQLQFSPDGKALAAVFGGAEGPINFQIWHAD